VNHSDLASWALAVVFLMFGYFWGRDRGFKNGIEVKQASLEFAIDNCEPEFIQLLTTEREAWIADNMRHEILQKVRSLRQQPREES
jgi:hypothetical protein